MAISGLDIGSGGCKCTIFNDDGSISSYSFLEYDLHAGPYGYYELNPETVWQSVIDVCKQANSEHRGDEVKALCITSFGESGVCLNKNDRVLYSSMMYSDPRGQVQCDHLIDKLGSNEIQNRSGHSPHQMFSACKLMWIKDNESEIFNDIDTFLQYSDYILYRLSGEKFVDWSLASRTLMFNVKSKKWDETLLDAAGLDVSIFSTPIIAGKVVATVNRRAADITGFKLGTQLLLGGQDQVAAAIGGGGLKGGQAVNGMGSVDCITPVFDRPIINDKMGQSGYACVPYAMPDHYVTYAFSFAGGSLLRWYRDKFGAQAVIEGQAQGVSAFEIMESKMPKDPTEILILPHWQGSATPYMDAESVGTIVGMDMNTDRNTLYRALMEGVAYEMKTNILKLADAGINIDRLTACGGGSKSSGWLQLRSDIFGKPIDVLEFEEAGTLGAAIMAGAACGIYKDIQDGVDRLVKVKKTYEPNAKNHERYISQFEKYQRMYSCVKEINGR